MAHFSCIHEYGGRFYVADYRDGQYTGSLTPRNRKLTGCSGFFCRTKAELGSAGGYSYSRRSDAVRKARELYGDE